MKTLTDIQEDMGKLYDAVLTDAIPLKKGAELANIAGKDLKAKQLELARDVFLDQQTRPPAPVLTPPAKQLTQQ